MKGGYFNFSYIHGSVHREPNLIIVQQDATVFSLLHFCRQLYMFRALTPIFRSSYSCNCSFWPWLNAMNKKYIKRFFIYTCVRASWTESNNCPTRCDLFSSLHFCRQLYMFRALTPIIRSSSNCKYSFWYWLTGSTTIRSRCWVGTDSCVS